MKFGYAWTFGEAPAPEKRTPSLPRLPAGLRNSNWAASPRRACFRLLGGFRIRFGYLERPRPHLPLCFMRLVCYCHTHERDPHIYLKRPR